MAISIFHVEWFELARYPVHAELPVAFAAVRPTMQVAQGHAVTLTAWLSASRHIAVDASAGYIVQLLGVLALVSLVETTMHGRKGKEFRG